jgi:hydroxysqualene synthase
VSRWSEPLARAYSACEAIARANDWNGSARLWLLPAAMRPHVAAIDAYIRVASDIANGRSAPPVDRLAALDAWHRRLHAAVAVERSGRAPAAHEDLIVVALAHSIRSLDLPIVWLDDVVSAFGEDTTTTRYDSWAELFGHCRRAANPLGRLVLRIADYRDDTLDRSSDALCTALRLTRFWQDFSHDWVIGRLYVPRDVTAACRAREMDLQGPFLNDSWSAAIRQCADQTRAQFEAGSAVCNHVAGRLRYERRLTWLGGMRLLERIERVGVALRSRRPAIGVRDMPLLLWRAARWRPSPP